MNTKQCPAEALNHTNHGIDSVEGTPGLGKKAARIGDGCCEKPYLDQKWYDVTYIAKLDIGGRKP